MFGISAEKENAIEIRQDNILHARQGRQADRFIEIRCVEHLMLLELGIDVPLLI
jgi:hypothetical protein